MDGKQFMRRAIALAKKGEGRVNPNPQVGAVIVKNGEIIGEGFHRRYGGLHAEREALKNCAEHGNSARGAEIYVTLEPCRHTGKQPPCTEALQEAGIKKVIIGSKDPNKIVCGKGIDFLRAKGIEVVEDFLRDECDKINKIFFHYITKKTPFAAVKYAMSFDGKIATVTGDSKWITNKKSRTHVHKLRNKYACILAGINTVLADDPLLTCRIKNGRNPVRIICDSTLRIPLHSNIVKTAPQIKTIIAASENYEKENYSKFLEKKKALEDENAEVITIPETKEKTLNLAALMIFLGGRGLDSVLIEGGSKIHYSALKSKIVQYLYCYIAPKIFGGETAKTPVAGEGVKILDNCFNLKTAKIKRFDDDILIEAEVNRCLQV